MNTMTREVTGVEVTETMDYWYDIVTRKEYRVKVIRRLGHADLSGGAAEHSKGAV